ncbi:MAG: tyrosine-type recombinase/integrase [Alphaproteobacteria bacterium]|nr:tyrosine-type recombinase/integrase [Alphaproteobacteria bacterium]
MTGRLNRLTARAVATLTAPKRHADGGGLYLKIRPNGSRSWVFMYERLTDGKRKQTEIGLGRVGNDKDGGLSLASAREKAGLHRRVLADGLDPLSEMRAAEVQRKAADTTFGSFADDYVTSHRPQWSNRKHADQWEMTLSDAYCREIRSRPIGAVDTGMVLKVLEPVWQEKPETARRIRMRLERVLDAAKVRGLRSGDNPARWRGHLDHLLPKHGKATKSHHAAMPFDEVPAFMAELAGKDATAARALRFLILTATRTGETLNARWEEIDTANRVWIIPAERMKARRPHRVPLSATAIAILEEARGEDPNFVFPALGGGRALSNMALLMLLRRMDRDAVTVHGFRSSFRDWAAERTSFPREVAEMALAHAVSDQTEAAYRRGDLFDKRRELMEAWAGYCGDIQDQGRARVLVIPDNRK